MYDEYFHFNRLPFKLTPDTDFFCFLKPHEEAFKTLLISLEHEEGFIKITGPIGTGKTMICRQLIDHLDDRYVVAYIPNPAMPAIDLYKFIIYELSGELPVEQEHASIFKMFNLLLHDIKKQGKKAVLLVDESQTMTDEGLESIRLMTNMETSDGKLLQVVLFGQPELDIRLEADHLMQLKQRILFSYRLTPLSKAEFLDYVTHRIAKAGYSYHQLFDKRALNTIYKASAGIPRLINILCHKALLASYAKGERQVSKNSATAAIRDTLSSEPGIRKSRHHTAIPITDLFLLATTLTILVAAVWHFWLGII